MPLTGSQLVALSLEQATRIAGEQLASKYARLEAHYDADLKGVQFFPQYFQESNARYQKRPKEVLPLCQATIDILAAATIGDGVLVSVGDPKSKEQEAYQRIQQHNDLDGANALAMSALAGIYGWGMERPILIDGNTVEFERVTPLYFRPYYDNGAIGRTIRRMNGFSFTTLWDADASVALPRNTAIGTTGKAQRVEVITPDQWWVFLDGKPQPTQPGDDSIRWMPRDDGVNPYGAIPATMLWNIVQFKRMEGRSDIDPGYMLAEELNRVYSQLLYNLQMVFPTLTIPKSGVAGASAMALGLGLGLEYDLDGTPPSYIAPPFTVENFMAPLRTLMTLFFSMVHTPASAHGLGTIFGEQTGESGKAKFYELGGMEKHCQTKRANYRRFVEARWKSICAIVNAPAPYGWGAGLNPDATIQVEFPQSVVPVSQEEVIAAIETRLRAGIMSKVEAILESRGMDDTVENRELAQKVLDDIGDAATRTQPANPLDRLIGDTLAAGRDEDEGE